MKNKYHIAYDEAAAELQLRDAKQTARLAGGVYDPATRSLTIKLAHRPVSFHYDDSRMVWRDTGLDFDKHPGDIAIIHYLVNAGGDQPGGDFVPYRGLWGAGAQSGPFIDRPEASLAEAFAADPAAVLARARGIGADIEDKNGDAEVTVSIFPHIPVRVMLYGADDELPAEAKFLFDSVISRYLPTEDITWVADFMAWLLVSDSAAYSE